MVLKSSSSDFQCIPPGLQICGALFRKYKVEEKEMATHSSILAWRLPWTEEPGKKKRKKKIQSRGIFCSFLK